MPETAHADPSTRLGAFLHASRPRTLPAAAAPVLVAVALAWAEGVFVLWPAVTALTCALLLQIGTNFANDYYDHVHGADNDERVGETRVTAAGIVQPAEVRAWMLATFLVAAVLGLYLVHRGGWPILAIGAASILAGVLYTGGPWPYGYHGLGDLFVLVFFGLVAVAGTYYVQALTWSTSSLIAGIGVGAMATAILVVNNLRDIRTDAKAGKTTLAVIMGRTGTQIEYMGLLAVGLATPIAGVLLLGWSPWALLALGAFLLAGKPLHKVLTFRDPSTLDPALAQTARVLGAYGLLLAAGLVL